MTNLRSAAILLATLSFLSAGASAQYVTITTGGTFTSSDTTGPFSAPNATWTLSFQVAAQPVVTAVTASQFTTTYTNGVFTLNGTPITLTGSSVTFVSGGGFTILLNPTTEFEDNSEEPSFFSGSTSSPTMLPGTYPTYIVFIFGLPSGPSYADDGLLPYGSVVITAGTTTPSPTPLPPSATLVLTGMACLGLQQALRKRNQAMRNP